MPTFTVEIKRAVLQVASIEVIASNLVGALHVAHNRVASLPRSVFWETQDPDKPDVIRVRGPRGAVVWSAE